MWVLIFIALYIKSKYWDKNYIYAESSHKSRKNGSPQMLRATSLTNIYPLQTITHIQHNPKTWISLCNKKQNKRYIVKYGSGKKLLATSLTNICPLQAITHIPQNPKAFFVGLCNKTLGLYQTDFHPYNPYSQKSVGICPTYCIMSPTLYI